MLTTNLLPLQQKKIIAREENRRVFQLIGFEFAAVLAIAAILLLPSFLPLEFERTEVERAYGLEQDAARALKTGDTRAKSNSLQAMFATLTSDADKEDTRASSLLATVLMREGKEITLTSILTRKGGDTFISGTARTRRDLLDFEAALRADNMFQTISSPLSNIIREQDVNFTLQGKLKSPYAL